jgi:hypothetical protein
MMKSSKIAKWMSLSVVAMASCVAEPPSALLSGDDAGGTTGGGVGSTQAPLEVAFRPDIQADLDQLGCTSQACHGGASLPMQLVAFPADDESWAENYQAVKARAGSVSASPLRDKALGDGGHIDPLHEDDPIVTRWMAWVSAGAPFELTGDPPAGGAGSGGSGEGGAGTGATGTGGAGGFGGESTWDGGIAALLVGNACLDCHGTSGWQGAYSLASYTAALGFGTDDVPNVVPGDASSKLVEYAEAGHHGIGPGDAAAIRAWVLAGAPES